MRQPPALANLLRCVVKSTAAVGADSCVCSVFVLQLMVGPAKTLFMDEISTGLDSSTTYLIVRCIRNYVTLLEVSCLSHAPTCGHDSPVLRCVGIPPVCTGF